MRRRKVDATADRPVYKQLADDLRDGIRSSEFPPGSRLPSEADLCDGYGVGLNSVRAALAILRSEGLVITRPQQGSWVRQYGEVNPVKVPPGAHISTRMPTEQERHAHGIPEGTPVLVIEQDGDIRMLAGDRNIVETTSGTANQD